LVGRVPRTLPRRCAGPSSVKTDDRLRVASTRRGDPALQHGAAVTFTGDPADALPERGGGACWWLRADDNINDLDLAA
jgi:hypothetical protein